MILPFPVPSLLSIDTLGDVRNMKELFESETFDCVIDKGLLDSVLVNVL